jgi:hypothetical protein
VISFVSRRQRAGTKDESLNGRPARNAIGPRATFTLHRSSAFEGLDDLCVFVGVFAEPDSLRDPRADCNRCSRVAAQEDKDHLVLVRVLHTSVFLGQFLFLRIVSLLWC